MSSKGPNRLTDLMQPGEAVAQVVERMGGTVEQQSPAFDGIVDERTEVERITDAIGDLIDEIVEAAAEPDLAEPSTGEVTDLRRQVEYLAAAIETYIEKAQPERMTDN